MPTGGLIQIFLLDDHEIVRRGLHDLLERQHDFLVGGETGSAQEAMRRIPVTRPDVAVLDLRLPDGSGVEVSRVVRSADASIKVLLLTSSDDDDALQS